MRAKFVNELRQTTTGNDGTYFLAGCEPRMTRIVVSAKGRAMELQTVRVEPDMRPVDFILKPGGHVRVRVLDENEKPIPRARIFFQKWRGGMDYFEFDHINDYADQNGVWEWNEAPLDEFKADICRPNGMQLLEQPLVAREEEYVFRPPQALVISGKVVDAATNEPIKKFRVVPGQRWDNSDLFWDEREGFDATDGHYLVKRNRGHIAHQVRVEADGYQRKVSRDIKSDEGNVTIDFALEPAKNLSLTIVTPEGTPAAKAVAALGVSGSQINLENGAIDNGSTYARQLVAEEDGSISFPPPDGPFQLVVAHPSGFAHLKSAEAEIPETIKLTPWARVEGVFKVGSKPLSDVTLNINSNAIHSYGSGEPNIFTTHETTTGADGRFVFDRVLPGKGRLGRRIVFMVNDGATEVTSSKMVPVDLPAGETTRVDIGGDGRIVIGRLAPHADYKDKVHWNFASIHAGVRSANLKAPPVPADAQNNQEKYGAWWKEWAETDEGKAWRAASLENQRLRDVSPYFSASVGRDGTFRIDDVPPGNYELSVMFHENSPGQLRDYRFPVPAAEETDANKPVDLGVITLSAEPRR